MAKVSKTRKEECRAALLKILKPGDTVHCILRHVSRSGMMRHIDFYTMQTNDKGAPDMRWLSTYIADLGEYSQTNNGALKVGGCGMDMGFSVVYNLGAQLWPNGTAKPHGRRNGEPDSAGGYALKHQWL